MIYRSKTREYEVIRKLGEGEAGITYLVKDVGVNVGVNPSIHPHVHPHDYKEYVLKELKMTNLERWSIVDRFKKEIEILKTINHSGIPKFIDIIEDSDTLAYIQEYLEGKTFKEMIENNDDVSDFELKSYFLQALDILNYLHTMIPPIIHQDISPKNIIIQNDKLYLIDFGAVKTAVVGDKTQSLTTVGTLGYMAPEQIMGKAVTQSDLYSLGITFLALKNNKKSSDFDIDSYTGEIDKNKIMKVIHEDLKDVFLKIIEPTVLKRYKSAKEVIGIINKPKVFVVKKKFYKKKRYLIPFILLAFLTFIYIKSLIPVKGEIKSYGGWFSGHLKLINHITKSVLGSSSFFGQSAYLYNIQASNSQKYIVSVSSKNFILWDYKKTDILHFQKGDFGYRAWFDETEKYIYFVDKQKNYRRFNIKEKKIDKEINLPELLLNIDNNISIDKLKCEGILSKNGKLICTSELKSQRKIAIYVINVNNKKAQKISEVKGSFSSKILYSSVNEKFIIPVYTGKRPNVFTYYVYNINNDSLSSLGSIEELQAISKNSNTIITGYKTKNIYTLLDNNLNLKCSIKKGSSNKSYLSNDGKLTVLWRDYSRNGGDIEIYETDTCKLIKKIERFSYSINNIEVTQDNKNILISDWDTNIKLFKIK